MSLPVFTARPAVPRDLWPKGVAVDTEKTARCCLCPEDGPVDDASGFGVECWRIAVLLPAVLRAERPVIDGGPVDVKFVPLPDPP